MRTSESLHNSWLSHFSVTYQEIQRLTVLIGNSQLIKTHQRTYVKLMDENSIVGHQLALSSLNSPNTTVTKSRQLFWKRDILIFSYWAPLGINDLATKRIRIQSEKSRERSFSLSRRGCCVQIWSHLATPIARYRYIVYGSSSSRDAFSKYG